MWVSLAHRKRVTNVPQHSRSVRPLGWSWSRFLLVILVIVIIRGWCGHCFASSSSGGFPCGRNFLRRGSLPFRRRWFVGYIHVEIGATSVDIHQHRVHRSIGLLVCCLGLPLYEVRDQAIYNGVRRISPCPLRSSRPVSPIVPSLAHFAPYRRSPRSHLRRSPLPSPARPSSTSAERR